MARRLGGLSARMRALFAAMIAERLFPHAAEFFGRRDPRVSDELRLALELLWKYGANGVLNHRERDAALAACMAAIRTAAEHASGVLTGVQRKVAEESGARALRLRDVDAQLPDADAAFFAENAAASIAYGLRATASDDPSEPAWAAQRAYDTVDRFVMMQERSAGAEWGETRIRSHPVVQQELQRQANDIEKLETLGNAREQGEAKLMELRKLARHQAESIFSPEKG